MNAILKTKDEKYIPKYFNEDGELLLTNLIPREIEKWEQMSALAAIKRGLVRSINFITP